MSRRWLVMRLQAPLMSFGGVAIDQVGPVRDYPAASMLTGLIGNALGWHWSQAGVHQALQDRLIFAVRRMREGSLLADTQNAQLARTDKGWTTRGVPEGRTGASYGAPHRRFRDYDADASVGIVLRVDPPTSAPNLEMIAAALDRPARPLFIGRKPCLPSVPMLAVETSRWVTADTAYEALCALPEDGGTRALWPIDQGPRTGESVDQIVDWPDLRIWRTGLHGGSRRMVEGRVTPFAHQTDE